MASEAQRIDAEVEPEAHDIDDRLEDLGVVEVEIGLMREETCQ
jgi:hypothetical protein